MMAEATKLSLPKSSDELSKLLDEVGRLIQMSDKSRLEIESNQQEFKGVLRALSSEITQWRQQQAQRPSALDIIPAGENKAIVRLRSGEFICVDTQSLDSLNYTLDFDVEPNIREIFRRFLNPNSVVLDIGANFGLYTVTSKIITRGRGRLFSFEGNPHTFEVLRRSVYANKMLNHPNVNLVNAIVGAAPGQGTIHYLRDELGGASVLHPAHWHGRSLSADVPVISIDEFLPPGIEVDLVKIDVEGSEPFVLKGMERTIERSARIRLIVEFIQPFVEASYGAQRFMNDIAKLGLSVCKIVAGPRLELVDAGQVPGGAGFTDYCLLTRTPEADISRRHFTITADGLYVHAGFTKDGRNMLLHDGVLFFFRDSWTAVADNPFFYGPYINLAAGRYSVKIDGSVKGVLPLRFAHNFGHPIMETTLASFEDPIILNVEKNLEHFEVVGFRSDALESVQISAITFEPLG
jgi:FkbM family methyltransferase